MTSEELSSIIDRLRRQRDDDERAEAKRSETELSKDVWRSVSAFANTVGGTIILGLDQDSGFQTVAGFNAKKNIDQFVSGIKQGDGKGDGKVTNPPQYNLERHLFEDGELVVIEISELEPLLKPCFVTAQGIQNGSYKRVSDKDIKLSTTEIFALQNAMVPSPADRDVVDGATIHDLNPDVIDSIIDNERRSHPKALRGAETQEAQMARLNITDQEGRIRLGGLLATGIYPQQYYPKLSVDVMIHPEVEKSAPDGPRYRDRIICEGSLGEVIDDAVSAVTKSIRVVSVIEGVGRRDELEIPEEVVREAIANALIHREYSPRHVGQSVTVDIYPDRIEIKNPGGLWGGKTIDNLADGVSLCRNAALMRLASALELPSGTGSPAEGGGGGIPFMIRLMSSRTLQAPKFKADVDSFTVRLGRGGTELAANRRWISKVTDRTLTHHEQTILLALRESGTASVRDLRRELLIDSDEIRNALSEFELEGVVERIAPDIFAIAADDDGSHPKLNTEELISALLRKYGNLSIRELAEQLGKSVPSTRYHVKKLLEAGKIVSTASSTSRNRRYEAL